MLSDVGSNKALEALGKRLALDEFAIKSPDQGGEDVSSSSRQSYPQFEGVGFLTHALSPVTPVHHGQAVVITLI